MDTVEGLPQFSALTGAFTAGQGGVQTNCFLLPGEIRDLTDQGRLHYCLSDNDLFFCVDQGAFAQLLFYTHSTGPISPAQQGQLRALGCPIVLDLITRGNQTALEALVQTKWLPAGFQPHSRYLRLVCKAGDFLASQNQCPAQSAAQAIRHDAAPLIPEIYALWALSLDPYSIALPTVAELQTLIERRRVSCAVDDNGQLCAVAVANRHGNRVTLQHVSVHPHYRRQGIARRLLAAAMREDLTDGVTGWLLWVAADNEAAIQLYQRLGFAPDGMVSAQFILSV